MVNDYDFINYKPEPFLVVDGLVTQDYAEWSGEDPWDIVHKITNHKHINALDVAQHGSVEKFYAESRTYIYDILGANWNLQGVANKINKFIPNALLNIKQHPGIKFAEFGGGTGVFCDIITKLRPDMSVTYIDIDSYITEFAKWRIAKHNLPIQMKIIEQEDFTLDEQYDIIFTDAVWEHLPPEKQITYGTKLADGLAQDGLLYMIVDLSGHTEDMPMHFDCDIVAVHNNLQASGLTCVYGRNNFASVWRK